MKVTSVGGGPGGLYAAILLKLADPGAEVVVHERNAADDTFGFGVVFSEATLGQLADADPVSYDRLIRSCARWDPVEIRYRGARVRARGNRFAAISRHRLLAILQERAADLGADVRFGSQVDDIDALRGDTGLLLGADGRNSAVRRRWEHIFRPTLTAEGSRYIWLGTTRPFDAFTFIFRETGHGPFQAHIYPFSETTATFIVEAAPQVWRDAGFDAVDASALPPGVSDDRAIAVLRDVFADDLDGHPLLPNNSKWLEWTTVRTATWRHGTVALLGDAAHTAHFSIGSGTKLAMEDAIVLVDALHRVDDLDDALAEYEATRRPAVERVQQAAAESLDWFARYRRYWGFSAPQFAYSLLTRSARIDHDNLARRDPGLVRAFDRWFAEDTACGGHTDPVLVAPPPVLTPVADLGGRSVVNRVVLTVCPDHRGTDGHPTAAVTEQYHQVARGGAGVALLEHVAVSADARITPGDAGLWTEAHAAVWGEVLADLHDATPTLLGVQLTHAGPRGATRPRDHGVDLPLRDGGWPLVAASAQPYTIVSAVPHPLDERDRAAIAEDFALAAGFAYDAGFDLVEVQMGHGYLLASFLSPLTNHRDDDLGGDLERRMRFPLEVLHAVRDAWPAGRPLAVRMSASDLQPSGLTEADAVMGAQTLVEHGADVVHVVAGQTTPHARPDYARTGTAPWSDLIRNSAGVPTVAGRVRSLSEATHVVSAGRADLVVLSATPPAEPAWLAEQRTSPGRTVPAVGREDR